MLQPTVHLSVHYSLDIVKWFAFATSSASMNVADIISFVLV